MAIIVDTHVHLYPEYDREAALCACAQRLELLAPSTVTFACLAERHDCHAYKALLAKVAADGGNDPRYQVLEDGHCIVFRPGGGESPLFVLPGRQIATRERLEILCLGGDASIPDGEPAELTIRRISEVGGMPVLAWAVGKWLFKRRRIVAKLLNQFGPDRLLIGDSAMRPTFWPEPAAMRRATREGYHVIAGSDPLPRTGDEHWTGRYATLIECALDPQKPSETLLRALRNRHTSIRRVGSRCGIFAFPRRLRG
ncbi:MAG TPA: hypothetical protein DCS43_01525 [Verrucomicrobia bacterium]|nr:hypothetical protein [Verrucomicrobiota bacterium]